jgi:hypothetical protein
MSSSRSGQPMQRTSASCMRHKASEQHVRSCDSASRAQLFKADIYRHSEMATTGSRTRAHAHTYTRTRTRAHAQTHPRAHTHTYTRARTRAHARAHTHTRAHTRALHTRAHTRTCAHTLRTRAHAHAHAHTRVAARTHAISCISHRFPVSIHVVCRPPARPQLLLGHTAARPHCCSATLLLSHTAASATLLLGNTAARPHCCSATHTAASLGSSANHRFRRSRFDHCSLTTCTTFVPPHVLHVTVHRLVPPTGPLLTTTLLTSSAARYRSRRRHHRPST